MLYLKFPKRRGLTERWENLRQEWLGCTRHSRVPRVLIVSVGASHPEKNTPRSLDRQEPRRPESSVVFLAIAPLSSICGEFWNWMGFFLNSFIFYFHLFMHTYSTAFVWKSKDNCGEWVFPSRCGPGISLRSTAGLSPPSPADPSQSSLLHKFIIFPKKSALCVD